MGKKQRIILRLTLHFLISFIIAAGIFLVMQWFISFFVPGDTPEDWHLVLFMLMPVGSAFGIFLIDRLVFRLKQYSIIGIAIGFLFGFMGLVLVEWFLPWYYGMDMGRVYSFFSSTIIGSILVEYGIKYVLFLPFTSSLFCFLGYNSVLLFQFLIKQKE